MLTASRVRSAERSHANDSSGVRLIARVAAVLRSLSEHRDGLSIRQLSEIAEVPRATVQRIIEALEHENLVMRASSFSSFRSGVRLGPGLITLADSAKKFDLVEFSHPLLMKLSAETRETVDLAVLGRNKAMRTS
jgi:IclR family acetate operon transcriptional repressor